MTHYAEGEPRGAANLPPSTPLKTSGRSRTRQEDARAADINNIMAKYVKTRVLPLTNRSAFFADVAQIGDFSDVVDRVHMAEEAFLRIDPKIRARFDNDPAEFLDFTTDPKNRAELVQMGLIEHVDAVEDVVPTPVPTPTPPAAPAPEPGPVSQ